MSPIFYKVFFSIFDTPSERYSKLKSNIENVTPLQVGLTAFTFDANRNSYKGRVYTFYVQPACFQYVNRNFLFQSNTISFLKSYNFDFNKFVYDGIPFINKDQELILRQKLQNNEISELETTCLSLLEGILSKEGEVIKLWYEKAKPGDFLEVPKVFSDHHNNEEMVYFLQKILRSRFENLWTTVKNSEFIVKKVSPEELQVLEKKLSLEDELIDSLTGFSKVIKLIISLKKPIVGHNFYIDLLLIIHNFETPLPSSYSDFKKLTNELFPTVFDSKTICYGLQKTVSREKMCLDKGLDVIFDYFKNGAGRHIAPNSPAIEVDSQENNFGKIHDAGWDSFCTGYVFIRLAHFNIHNKYPTSKIFVTSEYIGGLMSYLNTVNVIRGSVSCIKLDGPDPISTRPPYLVIESRKNTSVNIPQITSLLSTFGYVEIRKIRFSRTKALIGVDNNFNAQRILKQLKNDREFRVSQYSLLRHSPITKILLMSGISFSGALILWLTSLKK